MQLLDEALFERAVQWIAQREGEANVRAARKAFEEVTGTIEASDPDHESRIQHFFESWLCAERADGPPLIAQFAAGTSLERAAQRQLAGWQLSHRSLFCFEGFSAQGGMLGDLLLGGRYRFWPAARDQQLSVGDRLDARLIAGSDGLWLSPGRVYHVRASFGAMQALMDAPGLEGLSHRQWLDGLLRMRSRLLRFASIRPEHVFCPDGFAEQAFAAPWAKPAHRARHQAS